MEVALKRFSSRLSASDTDGETCIRLTPMPVTTVSRHAALKQLFEGEGQGHGPMVRVGVAGWLGRGVEGSPWGFQSVQKQKVVVPGGREPQKGLISPYECLSSPCLVPELHPGGKSPGSLRQTIPGGLKGLARGSTSGNTTAMGPIRGTRRNR